MVARLRSEGSKKERLRLGPMFVGLFAVPTLWRARWTPAAARRAAHVPSRRTHDAQAVIVLVGALPSAWFWRARSDDAALMAVRPTVLGAERRAGGYFAITYKATVLFSVLVSLL